MSSPRDSSAASDLAAAPKPGPRQLDVELLPEQIDSATALRDEDYLDARPPHHG